MLFYKIFRHFLDRKGLEQPPIQISQLEVRQSSPHYAGEI